MDGRVTIIKGILPHPSPGMYGKYRGCWAAVIGTDNEYMVDIHGDQNHQRWWSKRLMEMAITKISPRPRYQNWDVCPQGFAFLISTLIDNVWTQEILTFFWHLFISPFVLIVISTASNLKEGFQQFSTRRVCGGYQQQLGYTTSGSPQTNRDKREQIERGTNWQPKLLKPSTKRYMNIWATNSY